MQQHRRGVRSSRTVFSTAIARAAHAMDRHGTDRVPRIESLEPRALLSGISFEAAQTLDADMWVWSPVTADFDADGRPDFAYVTNSSTDTVDVVLNKSGTRLDSHATYSVVDGPTSLVTADFNGDGKPDLATLGSASTLGILLNSGDGTFSSRVDSITAATPGLLTSADVNGDGSPDLISADSNGALVVLANDGTGVFTPAGTYSLGTAITAVKPGDFDADAKTDLALVIDGKVYMFWNDGAAGFHLTEPLVAATDFHYLTTGDFDTDGRPDLVVSTMLRDAIQILHNAGSRSFADAGLDVLPFKPQSMRAADLDGDGRTDLAISSFGVHILLNRGATFVATGSYRIGGSSGGVASIADFNVDGLPDLLVASHYDSESVSSLGILFNRGDGSFLAKSDYATAIWPNSIAVADFDGDGSPDVFAAGRTLALTLNRAGAYPNAIYTDAVSAVDIVSADFDADGRPDIATANAGGAACVFLNQGSGALAPVLTYLLAAPTAITAADFDGDDLPDLALASPGASGVSLLLNRGGGFFVTGGLIPLNAMPVRLIAADLNGDGTQDLAVITLASSIPYSDYGLSILLGAGDGSFTPTSSYDLPGSSSSPVAADFNGDSRLDLAVAVQGPFSTTLRVLLNTGDGSFAPGIDYTTGQGPSDLVAADFDGDGDPDLAAFSSIRGTVTLNRNNGDGTFAREVDYFAATAATAIAAADVNGDGMPDLIVPDFGQNTVNVLLNNTALGPGNHAPTDLLLSPNRTPEHQPAGTVVGNFRTIDPDVADQFAYALVAGDGDADNALFSIAANSLAANTGFNYETRNSYSIRVRVTDLAGLSLEKPFTIGAIDVPEPIGSFGLLNGARLRYTITDSDGDRITFSLTGGGTGTLDANHTLALTSTTARSVLTIRVSKARTGDGYYALDGITVDGLLKRISAPRLHMTGGLLLNSSGATVGDAAVTIRLQSASDLSIHTNGLPIRSLYLRGWTDSDEKPDQIVALWIGSIQVIGAAGVAAENPDEGLSGSLQADVVANAAYRGRAIGSIRTTGDIATAHIWAEGNIGSVYSGGALTNSRIAASGSIQTISAAAMARTSVFAGVDADLGDPFVQGISGFNNGSAKVSSLTIRGRKLARDLTAPAYITDSHISAPLVGKISLTNVPANAGHIIHIYRDTGRLMIRHWSDDMLPGGTWAPGTPARPDLVEVLS